MKRGRNEHIIEKNNEDRLSALSDDVLHHILSFNNAKQAVQSCILSTRWKILWKTLPTLTLKLSSHSLTSYCSSETLERFTKFVIAILSQRDVAAPLHVLELDCDDSIDLKLLKMILTYAFMHNVQRLLIDVKCQIEKFPPSFFSCQTLRSLNLYVNRQRTLYPNSLNLPALTNLSLQSLIFCVNNDGRGDPFSTLKRLNSLIINDCLVSDNQSLSISSVTLANLSISGNMKFQLSTPSLCTFDYSGTPLQKLCGTMNNLSSVKHVTIYVPNNKLSKGENTPFILLNWLIELANIESLAVSLHTLKVLSLVPDLFNAEFSSLYNLKSLKVTYLPSSSIAKEVVDFLLQNAPLAKVTSYLD
ncbi:unnamed protein product [Trifolium pratense]|uniref:Uncharacterized protein n=1 Tax=Trifolium pratense TaxID=57577 RepID=A0ACB0J3H2_TRIPR|nr:unnamed protein product [Trifolium pratense]